MGHFTIFAFSVCCACWCLWKKPLQIQWKSPCPLLCSVEDGLSFPSGSLSSATSVSLDSRWCSVCVRGSTYSGRLLKMSFAVGMEKQLFCYMLLWFFHFTCSRIFHLELKILHYLNIAFSVLCAVKCMCVCAGIVMFVLVGRMEEILILPGVSATAPQIIAGDMVWTFVPFKSLVEM